jgi:prophage DNA circulation protein
LKDNSFNRNFLAALESDAVAKRLGDVMRASTAAKDDELNRKFQTLVESINSLRQEIAIKDGVISQLQKSNQDLKKSNHQLLQQLEESQSQL